MSRLQPTAPGTAPASPAQQRFAQLQVQLAAARSALAAWDLALPAFQAGYAEHAAPLRAELLALRDEQLQRIAALLDEKGLSKSEKAALRERAAARARQVLDRGGLAAAAQAHWRLLHDLHAEQPYATLEQDRLEQLRTTLAAHAGLAPEDLPADSPDELWRRLHEHREAQAAAAQRQRRTAAQRREAAAEAALQAEASQSVRAVFRKLASALHPDRATSPSDQAWRTAQMQRVNEAYAREDLLALHALQLEIEQGEAPAPASGAQLRHLNQVMAAQLEELQAELAQRAARLCRDFQLQPRHEPRPEKLTSLLNEAVAALRAELMDVKWELRQLAGQDSARAWLRSS